MTHDKPAPGGRITVQGSFFDVTAAVTAAAATTEAIDKQGFPVGSFTVPTGSPINAITWYHKHPDLAEIIPANKEDGSPITQTVAAGQGYAIPKDLAGYPIIYPVANAAGTLYVHLER